MFDFPQPGEIYRSAGFPDVAVVGILEDGIPWEMPYRCPDIVWNPYRRKFSILVRILADGRTTDIPLGRFLREFTCDRPDLFKRSPVNRHAVLKEMAGDPMLARSLLQSQQNSDEALNIKRDADPTFDFIGYLETLPQTSGMYMGNASIIPRNYRKYLYHAYLAYMEANGYRNVLSLKMFGLGLPVMLKEYGLNYEKRHTKQGIQTNLTLKEESYGDWLPKCDDPATT